MSIQTQTSPNPEVLKQLLAPITAQLQTLRLSCLAPESLAYLCKLIPEMQFLSTLDLPDSPGFETAALIELLKRLEGNENFFTLGLGQRTRIQTNVELKNTLSACSFLIELSPSMLTDPIWRQTHIEPVLARNRIEQNYQQFKRHYGPKILLLILCTRRKNKPRPWLPPELYEEILSFMIALGK